MRFFGASEPLAWTLQWMMSGTVAVTLVMAWRSRLPYSLKAAALATATLLVTGDPGRAAGPDRLG